MNRTTITRWTIATVVFLAIGWIDFTWGHRWGLAALVLALVVVYRFGGHGPRPGRGQSPAPPPE